VVEKAEERNTSTENLWIICNMEDIDHEKNCWYKLGRTSAQHSTSLRSRKHFKCSTYNVLIESYNGVTTNDALYLKVADDPGTRTEFSKYQALHVSMGWIHFCFFCL
jgi:hypothetical protein